MKVAARVVFHFGEQLPISGVIPPGGRAVASGTPAAVRYQLSPGQPEPDRPPAVGGQGVGLRRSQRNPGTPSENGGAGAPERSSRGRMNIRARFCHTLLANKDGGRPQAEVFSGSLPRFLVG
jgi:hypothetical protein